MANDNNNVTETASSESSGAGSSLPEVETLIVVSKVKKFIREQGQLNTSECCVEALSKKIASEIVKGIERAKSAGRKTLMGRDIGDAA